MSLKPVTSLGARRAAATETAAGWTPIEMLRATLAEWEQMDPDALPDRAIVTYGDDDQIRFAAAGTRTGAEQIGMLWLVQQQISTS